MRSLLFVPAHKEDLIQKALKSNADALIFDLEDSCPGLKNKEVGLKNIQTYAPGCPMITITRISEVSQLKSLVTEYILLPKADEASYYTVRESTKKILLLIETCRGVIDLPKIAKSWNINGLVFGNEDYTADSGSVKYEYAQSVIVNNAHAYGNIAIDTVNVDVHNLVALNIQCRKSVRLGFDGKLCLSPKEIPIVHRIFTPTQEEYDRAIKMIEMYDRAERNGSGVAILDGIYVAPPMVKVAQKIIRRYEYYTQKHQDNL